MSTKKQLVIISFILALVYHFIFYLDYYGPSISIIQGYLKYGLAFGSALIIFFLYLATYWRNDLKGQNIAWLYNTLLIWMIICIVRSLIEIRDFDDSISFFFSNYMALSLMPILFFIVGVNINYFSLVNRLLTIYMIFAFAFSLLYINTFELQLYLVYPLFFVILTLPFRSKWGKFLILAISVVVIIFSLTNRAGLLRILYSYSIVAAYYIMMHLKINKRLLYAAIFIVLMVPVVALYLGIKGQSVFQIILGDDGTTYSQLNPYADTRTFLYYEVLQDLKFNNAFIFGKGMNAGYDSLSFGTYKREVVEVGFLQILMKTGIVGFILYISVILSAIFKSIGKSRNLFLKGMGLFLTGYLLMLFIENQIAYNLLNIIVWIVVGMCHSKKQRDMNDAEVEALFNGKNLNKINPSD